MTCYTSSKFDCMMRKYEVDWVIIVKDTEQTQFGLQTDGQMGGETERQRETNIPLSTSLVGVY